MLSEIEREDVVRRYGRPARWFHAGIYVSVLIMLATGWWFVLDGYATDSPPARLLGQSDATIHELAGVVAILLVIVWVLARARATVSFIAESLRYDRGDSRWFTSWPKALFTGRFPYHDRHFDPGQRIANLVMVLTLGGLAVSGVAMLVVGGGPVSDWSYRVHGWCTYLVTPVILGHILVASGLLPGYRGVWRSMHLGGRLPRAVARRIWPGWADRPK